MKAIKAISMVLAVAAVGCGGQEVDSDYGPVDPTATETPAPTPTPTPNSAPVAPALAASSTSVRSAETIELAAASTDVDGDAITYQWRALLQDADGSVDAAGLSSTEGANVTFTAPVSNGIGTVTIEVVAHDVHGAVSEASRVDVIVNPVVIDPNDFNDDIFTFDICRVAPQTCLANPNLLGQVLETRIPDLNDLKPEFIGGNVPLAHPDFQTTVNVGLTDDARALAWQEIGSVNMVIGANGKGFGYRLEIFPDYAPSTMPGGFGSIVWKFEVTALGHNSLEPQTVLMNESNTILSGSLAYEPTTISARHQDGVMQISINGSVLPSFAASNVAGAGFSVGTWQTEAQFSNFETTLLK